MIDVKLEYRLGNRRVGEKQFFDGLQKEATRSAARELEKKLRRLRDPTTGERLRVKTRSKANGEIDFELSGPEALIKQAKRELR